MKKYYKKTYSINLNSPMIISLCGPSSVMQTQMTSVQTTLTQKFPTEFPSIPVNGDDMSIKQWASSALLSETFLCTDLAICTKGINNMMQLDPSWLGSPEYLPANSVTYAQAKVMLGKVTKGAANPTSLLDPTNMYNAYFDGYIKKQGYSLGAATALTFEQTKAFGVYLNAQIAVNINAADGSLITVATDKAITDLGELFVPELYTRNTALKLN